MDRLTADAMRRAAPEILRLAAPAALGLLSQWVLQLADVYMVGRLAIGATPERGVEAIANVHVGGIYMLALVISFNALAVGAQAVSARRWGENNREAAAHTLDNGVLLALGLSVLLLPVYWLGAEWLVARFTGRQAITLPVVVDYLHIRFVAMPALLVLFFCVGWFNGVGNTRVAMMMGLIINALNIAGNWALIEGHWGLPRLEERGAALASALSTWAGLLYVVLYALFARRHRGQRLLRRWQVDPALMGRVVRLSAPSFVHFAAAHLGFLLFLAVIIPATREGSTAVAASGIVWSTASLSFFLTVSFGIAAATVMGQSLGAGDLFRAKCGVWTAALMALAVNVVLSVIYITLGGRIVALISDEPAVVRIGFWLYVIVGSFLITDALAIVLLEAFKGAGMTLFAMAVEVPINLVLFLGLAWWWAIGLDWGVIGGWAAFIVYSLAMAAVVIPAFQCGLWRHGRA